MGDRLPNQRSGIKRTYYRRGAHYKGNFYTKISRPRLGCGRENEKDVYGDQHSGVTNNRRWMDGWMDGRYERQLGEISDLSVVVVPVDLL